MSQGKSNEAAKSKKGLFMAIGGALVLVVALLFAYGQLKRSPVIGTQTSATDTTSAATTTTAPQSTTTAAPAATFGSVPADFSPSSASFVSSANGFVLGGVPCSTSATHYCDVLAVTNDTGATWTANPLPGIDLTSRGFFASSTAQGSATGAAQVRFANSTIGYVFDPGLYVTTDGGATFNQVSVPGLSGIGTTLAVTSLEIANGKVTGIVAPRQGPNAATPGFGEIISANIATSPSSFSTLAGPTQLPYAATYFQNSDGQLLTIPQAASPAAFFAPSGSTNWQGITPPCVSSHLGNGSIFAIGSLFAPGSSSSGDGLAMGCTLGVAAGSSQKEIDVSTTTGASWQVLASPPLGGDMSAVAAGSSTNVAVAAESGASFIYSTTNAGKSWNTFSFANNPLGSGGQPIYDLGYTTSTQAFAIIGAIGSSTQGQPQSSFYLTTDGGATWTQITF